MVAIDPPHSYGPLLRIERARLLDLLSDLDPVDWGRPTSCPGWSVLGLVHHMVGDDMGYLSGHRDQHHGTPPPPEVDEAGFIAWLDDLQVGWVEAARRISPRLALQLLEWMDEPVASTVESEDPSDRSAVVSWAGEEPVPAWLDHARELSERWIHRQQILDALHRPVDLRADLAGPVLDGLRWAYPFRLRGHRRPAGTGVALEVTGPEVERRWLLVSDGSTWAEGRPADRPPLARLRMSTDQGWRLLTNNLDRSVHGAIHTEGDVDLVRTLVRTRAIIGTPSERGVGDEPAS